MTKINFKQMLLMSHFIGVDFFKSVMSLKRKDKILPEEFYRNYFNANKGSDSYDQIIELIKLGFAEYRKGTEYYHLTEKGISEYRKRYEELVKFIRPANRNIEYLKERINFYCDFYNYNFCKNNSDHIINAYKNYWLNKYHVSHTTEDVIKRFEPELKKFFKKESVLV